VGSKKWEVLPLQHAAALPTIYFLLKTSHSFARTPVPPKFFNHAAPLPHRGAFAPNHGTRGRARKHQSGSNPYLYLSPTINHPPFPPAMIKTILKLALLVVVGLLGYNYFLGDEAEKARSREIVGKAKDLGKDAVDLLKSERQKMKDGKYDGALDRLDGLYDKLRDTAKDLKDSDLVDRIDDLTRRRKDLVEQLEEKAAEPSEATKRKLEDLTAETEELINEMEAQGQSAPE